MDFFSTRIAHKTPFFYGYVMLLLAMLMQIGTSPGQTFAVSAFTPSLLESLGLTQSQLGLAYMLGTVLAAVPLTFIGPLADRRGLKLISLVVITGLSCACVLASYASGFLSIFLAFFLLRFLGQGSLTLLSSNTTAMWFRDRIGRVSAILSIGTAIAFAWVPQWLSDSIDLFGWRETYRGVASLLLIVLVPLVLIFYCNRPELINQMVDGKSVEDSPSKPRIDGTVESPVTLPASMTLAQAARTGTYYVLGLSNIIWAMAGTGVLFYLYMLCDQRSLPEGTASGLFKLLGISMLVMQLAGGLLGDFLALNRLFGIGTSLVAGSLVWLYCDHSLIGARSFAVLFGAGQGMLIAISGVAWVRFYGRDHLGSVRGAVWCGTVAGSGCGPFLMGKANDLAGSYDLAILGFALAMTPLAVAGWFIQRR